MKKMDLHAFLQKVGEQYRHIGLGEKHGLDAYDFYASRFIPAMVDTPYEAFVREGFFVKGTSSKSTAELNAMIASAKNAEIDFLPTAPDNSEVRAENIYAADAVRDYINQRIAEGHPVYEGFATPEDFIQAKTGVSFHELFVEIGRSNVTQWFGITIRTLRDNDRKGILATYDKAADQFRLFVDERYWQETLLDYDTGGKRMVVNVGRDHLISDRGVDNILGGDDNVALIFYAKDEDDFSNIFEMGEVETDLGLSTDELDMPHAVIVNSQDGVIRIHIVDRGEQTLRGFAPGVYDLSFDTMGAGVSVDFSRSSSGDFRETEPAMEQKGEPPIINNTHRPQ